MNIIVITPAPAGSRAGNRATAERWARLLENAGHRVQVETSFRPGSYDLVLALHAWRSHEELLKVRASDPHMPIALALTGTDIYDHQHRFSEPTRQSMALADSLVGLHGLVYKDIPREFGAKLVTVLQSVDIPTSPATDRFSSRENSFLVSVIGHLRDEKDSLRAAFAARKLPRHSAVEVVAAGRAHNDSWATRARQEEASNSRFRWLGELDRKSTGELLAGSKVMVISSVMEGGANVVSEACRAGIPVIASDIPGNRGLLGADYPGYFPAGDETSLAQLLQRAEEDADFLNRLRDRVAALAPKFTPEHEQKALLEAVHLARDNASRSE